MAAEALLSGLIAANLAGGAGIVLVLALRAPVRAFAGSRAAYALWLIPPLAALASLLPARTIEVVATPAPIASVYEAAAPLMQAAAAAPVHAATLDWRQAALWVWAIGAAVALIHLIVSHRAAVRSLGRMTTPADGLVRTDRSAVGPAVIGFFSPRIVVPADFEARFDESERGVVLAHERAHLAGGHLVAKAVARIAVCLGWFNPLVHVAAAQMATDQELACDEVVMESHPQDRKAYASALLKTQAGRALPLGCAWPSRSARLLKTRVRLVGGPLKGARARTFGVTLAAFAAISAGLAAWAAEPPVEKTAPAPALAPDTKIAADPLANLGRDASAVLDVGKNPSLMLTETDHGVTATRTLKIGDEYREGWKITVIAARTATLTKGAQTRTVELTGLPQVAVAAPPPPSAPAKTATTNALAPASAQPDQPTHAEVTQYAADLAAARLNAIANANIGQILKTGGTPRDVMAAILAGNPYPPNPPAGINFGVVDPSTAVFINSNGQVALAAATYSVDQHLVLSLPDAVSYVAPVGALPTLAQAFPGSILPSGPPTTTAPPPGK